MDKTERGLCIVEKVLLGVVAMFGLIVVLKACSPEPVHAQARPLPTVENVDTYLVGGDGYGGNPEVYGGSCKALLIRNQILLDELLKRLQTQQMLIDFLNEYFGKNPRNEE